MSLQDEFGFRTKTMEEWVIYFKLAVQINHTNCWAISDEKIEESIYEAHKAAAAIGCDVCMLIHAKATAYAIYARDMQVKV